jgi:phospholipid/cholesterol/gamma-HCH transport system substrate-binding protein
MTFGFANSAKGLTMTSEPDRRFRHLEKKIGIFVLIAGLVIAATVLLVGVERDLFTRKYVLLFAVEKGTGFSKGMPVKLSGFRIGRVRSISLDEQARVEIVLQIDERYQHWIREDSTVRLVKEGLVGDAVIEVTVGTPSLPALIDGERIAYISTKGLDEQAEEIAEKVKPVLMEVRDIIGYVNDSEGDIKQALRNFRELSGDLRVTRDNADQLLTLSGTAIQATGEAAVSLLGSAETRVKELEETLVRFHRVIGILEQRLPDLLIVVERTMNNLEKTSAELNRTAERSLPAIPPMLDRAGIMLEETQDTVRAAQKIWPLSSHLSTPAGMEIILGDSHE